MQGIQMEADRDMAAALALIDMADDQGRLHVDKETAEAIRLATNIPETEQPIKENYQSMPPFQKPKHTVIDYSVSFDSFNHVYGTEVSCF